MTIVRHSENTRRREEVEEPLPYIPEKSVRQKLQVYHHVNDLLGLFHLNEYRQPRRNANRTRG